MAARQIFRETAVEAYRRRAEKDVVPRLVSRPVIVALWALVITLAGTAVMAWLVRVPTYADASGVVLGQRTAVLFLAPRETTDLRVGRPVEMQIGSSGTHVHGAVAKADPGAIGPDAASERYGLPRESEVITEPSRVVLVRVDRLLPTRTYRGSRLTARVQTGSQRLLTGVLGGDS